MGVEHSFIANTAVDLRIERLILQLLYRTPVERDDEPSPDAYPDVIPSISADKLPYENLVFEGGGAKAGAFCGALKQLERAGLLDPNGNHRIKRFAGTSAGAMTASLLAVGYSADEIKDIISKDKFRPLAGNMGFGLFRLGNLINFVRFYGIGSNMGINSMMADYLDKKVQKENMTFRQLYERKGKELCITVTNLNNMRVEYFHPKTTPDVAIRKAVRMSMNMPGYFRMIKSVISAGRPADVYFDGGLACNYPIHCFDGWFLSMKAEDSFSNKIQNLRKIDDDDRFGTLNNKTLGIVLYADREKEWQQNYFDNRKGAVMPLYPDDEDKLVFQKYSRRYDWETIKKVEVLYKQTQDAIKLLQQVTKDNNFTEGMIIEREKFKEIYYDKRLDYKHRERIFQDMLEGETFRLLDPKHTGKVSYYDFWFFVEQQTMCLQHKYLGLKGNPIGGLSDFMKAMCTAMMTSSKRTYLKPEDKYRTIGVNTGYIGTTDFDLFDSDMKFLFQRGENATKAFFREYKERSGN